MTTSTGSTLSSWATRTGCRPGSLLVGEPLGVTDGCVVLAVTEDRRGQAAAPSWATTAGRSIPEGATLPDPANDGQHRN